MTPQPSPLPRTRHRLPSFEDGTNDVTAANCWVDRFKVSIPRAWLSVPCDPDAFPRYLMERRSILSNDVLVERHSNGSLHVVFPQSNWLFRLQFTFRHQNGRWAGAGSLEANPTRLLAAIGDRHDFAAAEPIHVSELSTSRAIRPLVQTLDLKDNFVPSELLRQACNIDWCMLSQVYLSSVLGAVNELIGTRHDFGHVGCHEPLLEMSRSNEWALREVEFYQEFYDENAPLRTAEIADVARGLTTEFGVDEHGPTVVGERRIENTPSMQLSLGRSGIYLSVYAKTFNRLRMEVRYKKYPCRACGLARAAYQAETSWLAEMFGDIRDDAIRRLNIFLAGYRRQRRGGSASLVTLAICLRKITLACMDEEGLFYRVLSLLIINGGLTVSGDTRMQRVANDLMHSGIVHRVRITARGDVENYSLTPRFRRTIQGLRAIALQSPSRP